LPEKAFLDEAGQQTIALILVNLKQPSGLLNGRREPTHLDELAAYARFDVAVHR
jgi:hypothetical protein